MSNEPRQDAGVDRRGFFAGIGGWFAGLFAAVFGLPAAATLVDPALSGDDDAWTDVAKDADLKPGAVQRFRYPLRGGWETREEAGFLVRAESGDEIVAFSARCTHAGCKVRFKDDEFVCPCHGGKFSKDGEPLAGPVNEPLHRLETRIENDSIQVKA